MSNTIYTTSRRNGTRAGCAPGSVRFSVTLKDKTFAAFKAQADANHHGLSGEAAEAIERDLKRAEALQAARAS